MQNNWPIVKADEHDIPELYALQLIAFESEAEMIGSRDVPALQESPDAHRADFSNWVTLKLVHPSRGIIGAIRYRKNGDLIEVGRLMTHPDFRRQGIARRLLGEVDLACPEETRELYTCTKSWINIRLYEKTGYKAVQEVTEESGLSFVYMQKA